MTAAVQEAVRGEAALDPILQETLKGFRRMFEPMARPQTDEEARHHVNSPDYPLNDVLDDDRDDYVSAQFADPRAIYEGVSELMCTPKHDEVMRTLLAMVVGRDENARIVAGERLQDLLNNVFAEQFDEGARL